MKANGVVNIDLTLYDFSKMGKAYPEETSILSLFNCVRQVHIKIKLL